MRLLKTLYALALYAYPRAFRERFGQEMRQAFLEAAVRAPVRAPFVWTTFQDLLASAMKERMAAMNWSRIGAVAGALAVLLVGSTAVMQAFVVPPSGSSMESTLFPGDHVIVNKAAHRFAHDEVLAFRYPKDQSKVFIKRVAGLPGDRIEIRNKQVFRNGTALAEPWAKLGLSVDTTRDNLAELMVPEGQYFVLGDNRDNSLDSRFFGPVPEANVVGQPLFVYWSYDAQAKHTRWERTLLGLK